MIPSCSAIAGPSAGAAATPPKAARVRAGSAGAAARARRQRRQGHRPPRDHPDRTRRTSAELSARRARIYDLVARRFLAAFHPEAVFEDTTLVTEVAGETFRSRGRVMLEAGWRAVYGAAPPTSEARGAARSGEPSEGPTRSCRRSPRARRVDVRRAPTTDGARDEAAAALRRGRAARGDGGRRQARRGRRAARRAEGVGHRHAGHPGRDHRAPDRRRLRRARGPLARAHPEGACRSSTCSTRTS